MCIGESNKVQFNPERPFSAEAKQMFGGNVSHIGASDAGNVLETKESI